MRIKSDFATGECCSLLSHTVPIQTSTHWSYTMQRCGVYMYFMQSGGTGQSTPPKSDSGDNFGIRRSMKS